MTHVTGKNNRGLGNGVEHNHVGWHAGVELSLDDVLERVNAFFVRMKAKYKARLLGLQLHDFVAAHHFAEHRHGGGE